MKAQPTPIQSLIVGGFNGSLSCTKKGHNRGHFMGPLEIAECTQKPPLLDGNLIEGRADTRREGRLNKSLSLWWWSSFSWNIYVNEIVIIVIVIRCNIEAQKICWWVVCGGVDKIWTFCGGKTHILCDPIIMFGSLWATRWSCFVGNAFAVHENDLRHRK